MASHGLVYSILYAFGAICGWGGVSLGISAVASNQWIWYGSATTFGLWNTCFVRQCTPIANGNLTLGLPVSSKRLYSWLNPKLFDSC